MKIIFCHEKVDAGYLQGIFVCTLE